MRWSPGRSSRTTTATRPTAGCATSTFWISPSSIRKPRTLTWSSERPTNSSSPSARRTTRSPVRYIRAPGAPNGLATKRDAVSSGRRRYPRASRAPATYSSPGTPTGTGRSAESSTYTWVFQPGRPIAGARAPESGPLTVTHTVASVGP